MINESNTIILLAKQDQDTERVNERAASRHEYVLAKQDQATTNFNRSYSS